MNQNLTIRQYDELINLAYSSAFDKRPWRAFLEYFCDILEARDANIVIQNFPSGGRAAGDSRYLLVTSNEAAHLTREFVDAVMAADVIMEVEQTRAGEISEILPNTYKESRLYREFLT